MTFTTYRPFDRIHDLSKVAAAILLFSVVGVLLPASAAAMQFNARVSGTVINAAGNPLAGVKVTIMLVNNRRVDPIPPTELTTDDDGVVIVVYGEGFVSGEPYSFLRTDLR